MCNFFWVNKKCNLYSKSLPFEIKLENFKNKLVFDDEAVASFGITGYSDYEKLKTAVRKN